MRASRSRPAFSRLFFADDLVLFAKADMKNCTSVRDTLDSFCELSGQKISLNKSKVYFSLNISQGSREELCEVLGISSTPNLGKYLGFPLKDLSSSSQNLILWWKGLGVSMFDSTREHDTNLTRVFSG